MVKLEICANSVESCIAAQRGGAARVELCAAVTEGGITPSWGEMLTARRAIDIDLNVIIRPRPGDFLYTETEIETMLSDIICARSAGVDGVVFGCLRADGTVDVEQCRRLIAVAEGMSLTFHRAFDLSRDPFEALEQIIELGFDRVLTSGQRASAEEGAEMIAELVRHAAERIIIMPGGGITENNIARLRLETGASEFHLSLRERLESEMLYRRDGVPMGSVVSVEEYSRNVTSAERVSDALSRLLKAEK